MTLSEVAPFPRFRPSPRPLLAVLAAASALACQSAPARTIPDPLPETLEWAIPESDSSAYLGLEVRENDSGSLESLSFDPGVRVHEVADRSPAQAAGVRIDDVVLTADGTALAVPDDLAAVLAQKQGGERVTLGVQRGDTVFDVEVALEGGSDGGAATATEAFVLDPARTRGAWGTNDGAILVARAKDGPVGKLPLGARVVALDGEQIVSGRGLVHRLVAMKPGARVKFTVVERDGDESVRTIHLLDEGRRTTRFSIPIIATYDATADRSRESFVLLDFYIISLVRYQREGSEKKWSILRFIQFESGVGELDG